MCCGDQYWYKIRFLDVCGVIKVLQIPQIVERLANDLTETLS